MNNPVTKCRGCGADVVWMGTRAGKKMLVDAETYHGELIYDHTKHRSHWGTCPEADRFRKPKNDTPVPLTKSEREERGLK